MTQLETLRKKGYSEKQINSFYRKKEREAKRGNRYTIKQWENE